MAKKNSEWRFCCAVQHCRLVTAPRPSDDTGIRHDAILRSIIWHMGLNCSRNFEIQMDVRKKLKEVSARDAADFRVSRQVDTVVA